MRDLAEQAPGAFAQAMAAASAALKARPVYLQRMPFERRAEAVRRALARVSADDLGEELLAVYFLECRHKLLVAWLDAVGVEHEEGTLKDDAPPCPAESKLREAVAAFRRKRTADAADRDLLLRAFVAQRSIDWPALEALLAASG
jgi:hypothetical protein